MIRFESQWWTWSCRIWCLPHCVLVSIWSNCSLPCPHAPLSGMFTLCHCALEVCNLFWCYRHSQLRDFPSLRRYSVLALWCIRTVEDLWGCLKLDWMHFSLWDSREPMMRGEDYSFNTVSLVLDQQGMDFGWLILIVNWQELGAHWCLWRSS